MEILKFIFSSFWVFLGVLIIVTSIFSGISSIIKSSICLLRYKRVIRLLRDKNLELDLELSKYEH